jgi:hypothetical protein
VHFELVPSHRYLYFFLGVLIVLAIGLPCRITTRPKVTSSFSKAVSQPRRIVEKTFGSQVDQVRSSLGSLLNSQP